MSIYPSFGPVGSPLPGGAAANPAPGVPGATGSSPLPAGVPLWTDQLASPDATPAEREARQNLVDRMRVLARERAALDAKLDRAAPHEWAEIEQRLQEIDRDQKMLGRLFQQANTLSGTEADDATWNKFKAWTTRAERASAEHEVKLEFQIEQLVREAQGHPMIEPMKHVYPPLAEELASVATQLESVQNALTGDLSGPREQALRDKLEDLQAQKEALLEAKDAIDSFADDPKAQSPLAWETLGALMRELKGAKTQADRERIVGAIDKAARHDVRFSESPLEDDVYARLGSEQSRMAGDLDNLERAFAAAEGVKRLLIGKRIQLLKQKREALDQFKAQVNRLEESNRFTPNAWKNLETIMQELIKTSDSSRVTDLLRKTQATVTRALMLK